MTYIIAEPCIGVKDTACVDVCLSIASIRPKTRPKNSRKRKSSISILKNASTVGLASRSALSRRSLKRGLSE